MSTPQVIQVIQEIKDYVDKVHRCSWLENLQSDETRRMKARRYRDGAIKIMDLLRNDLRPSDITSYELYYQHLRNVPRTWISERLAAARRLWEYVLSLDERLSHERITSTPRHRHGGSRSHRPRPARAEEDPRRVRFQLQQPSAATARTVAAPGYPYISPPPPYPHPRVPLTPYPAHANLYPHVSQIGSGALDWSQANRYTPGWRMDWYVTGRPEAPRFPAQIRGRTGDSTRPLT
ncbi:hypothetical protein C8Q77DRAFT_794133 [Trametes polyzona]|nr:hypothetical protein C8Q77DRAFT_794133 [Trametes polyzona]